MRYVDPTGRIPNERDFFFTARAAAEDAASYAAGMTRLGLAKGAGQYEFGSLICVCCDSAKYYSTKLIRGGPSSIATMSSLTCKSGDKRASEQHSHPTINAVSGEDARRASQKQETHYVAYPDGSFVGYGPSGGEDTGPGHFDIDAYATILDANPSLQTQILRYTSEGF